MADKVRVLIVDDVAETRENVRKLLQFETDIEVVGTARTGKEAVQQTFEIKPDVILMDINMPDMDGITATEAIRQRDQVAQIVILSVQGDPNYMRRAMLAGARDFLTKPPMADELISAIRRAGQMAHATRAKNVQVESSPVAAASNQQISLSGLSQGKVIVVYSPKGGAGTTTLAVNLAVTLHNDETRSVLVDAKLQYGDVAIFLNEQGKTTIVDLTSRADELDEEVVESVVIKHAASGLRVLAAPASPEQAEEVSPEQFVKLIKYMRQNYAYVVVDTASTLDEVTLSALDNADIVILVVTQDIPAIKNCRLFLDIMNSIDMPRERICFVMNKYDKRISITPEKVGENLKQPVIGIVPLDERVVIPSVNRGVPFMIDNKSQPSSKAVFSLAEAIRKQIEKNEL
ncbi:MAG: response regulator [Anaerolineales bacterium]